MADTGTIYLGDGLYASHDGVQIRVFSHNGIHETNVVYMEPLVLENFEKWVENLRARGALPPRRA